MIRGRALKHDANTERGSYRMAVDVMLCYVHMAYVHVAIQTLLVMVFSRLIDHTAGGAMLVIPRNSFWLMLKA